MVTEIRSPLEQFLQREARHPDKRYLVQPLPGGQVQSLTWGEAGDQARRAAAWLRSLQLPPGSRVAIISKNCAHWIIADVAIWMAGHISVPLYPNLTAESVRQVLSHSEATVAFVGKLDDWPAMAPGLPAGVLSVSLPLHPAGRFDHSWDDLQACEPLQEVPLPDPASLATIIYTSGTTGTPKGVMHSYANFDFAASRAMQLFGVGEEDRLLSYLPLCHVAERMFVEMASIYAGQTIFFADSLDTFIADMRRARPTVFFGVPRIWTKFQMGVYAQMPAQKLDRLLRLPIVGRLVGRKVLAGLGLDAVRYALCGAAPVPPALLDWYRRLGLSVLEVYGMTENCGYSHVCRPGKQREGWIGQSSPGVEVRISDEGEVQVRSGATMLGYYKDPERTAETLTEDGYLRTGDKGEQDADSNLRLTGRLKEIFKTGKGKYVAPAPIENRLAVHSRIEQICVVGDGLVAPLGLCVLSEVGRQEAANGSRSQLEESLRQLVEEVNGELDKHERLAGLVLVKEVWSVDNGFLTPTLKIKRNVVESTYGARFNEWAERREAVQWHD
ncbi:Long-chain acyl-CoA synthetase (AMP-forming) [Pseudomonas citronellolis]|uniref:Long-chain acyl-CoA synthetase (AMP-forming) n=1 Tax=Pseudomonas citronellolis TaxID=53408 RepID=A0AAQ1KM02_9PSED|nr:AMP-binding protein [Pseudomonas citronellolis]MCL6692505.1 AMP-binding protein [Pseudomonas sp. R3.Fl]MCP1602856.1 long-subunit acyl-CoA synthetase (AMP-forming) [Pseudomonas citronellolis]MCP1653914.1 long-subunit acyl-CoA synthetase (AMP-forming) [Pseudomonas citronellolis]MCP1721188.1 long-subunit acyl-CoA synthetase (AMP-forming) [Pseudomonas citronellolis]TGC29720.1 AMP-binding protein [Pseudomonas citronellolis]